jgi:hypothetical protein
MSQRGNQRGSAPSLMSRKETEQLEEEGIYDGTVGESYANAFLAMLFILSSVAVISLSAYFMSNPESVKSLEELQTIEDSIMDAGILKPSKDWLTYSAISLSPFIVGGLVLYGVTWTKTRVNATEIQREKTNQSTKIQEGRNLRATDQVKNVYQSLNYVDVSSHPVAYMAAALRRIVWITMMITGIFYLWYFTWAVAENTDIYDANNYLILLSIIATGALVYCATQYPYFSTAFSMDPVEEDPVGSDPEDIEALFS